MSAYALLLKAIDSALDADDEPHKAMSELGGLVPEMRRIAQVGGFAEEFERCLKARSPGDINALFQRYEPKELPEDNPLLRATG